MKEKKELIKHAGKYHYADCEFPTKDQAVCNCPDNLVPQKMNEEIIKEFEDVLNFSKEIWDGWCKASEGERNNVKSFLRHALSQEREKAIDECLESLPKKIDEANKTWLWNDCLAEIRQKLQSLKKSK